MYLIKYESEQYDQSISMLFYFNIEFILRCPHAFSFRFAADLCSASNALMEVAEEGRLMW